LGRIVCLLENGPASGSLQAPRPHAPDRLREEISADYDDMIYAATREEVETRRKGFIANGGSKIVPSPMPGSSPSRVCRRVSSAAFHHQRHRGTARGVQATNQDADRAAVSGHRCHVVLGLACFRLDQHAQGRWLANARHQAH